VRDEKCYISKLKKVHDGIDLAVSFWEKNLDEVEHVVKRYDLKHEPTILSKFKEHEMTNYKSFENNLSNYLPSSRRIRIPLVLEVRNVGNHPVVDLTKR